MADVSKKSIQEVIEDKGSLKIIYLNIFVLYENIRYGTCLYCLSTYNRINELVNIMGYSFLFYGDYIGY
jgi:hypothetical protein